MPLVGWERGTQKHVCIYIYIIIYIYIYIIIIYIYNHMYVYIHIYTYIQNRIHTWCINCAAMPISTLLVLTLTYGMPIRFLGWKIQHS